MYKSEGTAIGILKKQTHPCKQLPDQASKALHLCPEALNFKSLRLGTDNI